MSSTISEMSSRFLIQFIEPIFGVAFSKFSKQASNFNSIREKICKVQQGWKEKIFSVGGKEVLIKAVA